MIDVRDGVVGLMGSFEVSLQPQKFADQNNWIIFGDELTLRAVSRYSPHRTTSGGYLGVTLPLVVARWFLAPPGRWRAVAGLLPSMSVLTLVLTISRSSWVAAPSRRPRSS